MLNSKFESIDQPTQANTNDSTSDAGVNLRNDYPRTERIETHQWKLQILEGSDNSSQMR